MKSHLLPAFRYLTRNKTLSLINALGLSIGISACLVIYLIASYELSFDTFQPDRDRIFRVYTRYHAEEVVRDYPGIYPGALNTIRDQIAGIESFTYLYNWYEKVEIADDANQNKVFDTGNNFVFTDANYFKVFTYYRWLAGNPESALQEPYQVVLTESRARMYFGPLPLDKIMGREIVYKDSLRVYVSGIVADIKENTDFNFTDFISVATAAKLGADAPFSFNDPYALNNESRLFIKVEPEITSDQVMAQFARHQDDDSFELQLQPLSDFHFNTSLSMFSYTLRSPVRKSTLEILIGLALALLAIAIINFINLETAQSSQRAKEVGVRKVLGSSRWSLIWYFLVGSFVLTFISVLIACVLVIFAFDYFNDFIPAGVVLDFVSPGMFVFLGFCLFGVPLLAGLYPALFLSASQPALALKNLIPGSNRNSRSSSVRKGLTIFQFFISQVLIILTLVVGLQIRYMLGKDLGFTTKAIITFHAPPEEDEAKKSVLRNSLAQIEGVEMISMQSQPPGGSDGTNSLYFEFESDGEPHEHWVNVKYGDSNYLSLYDIKLIAGKNFNPGDSANGFIINEAYMNKLGFLDPRDILGKTANGKPVIGVVKNFHTESLHTAIQPTAIVFDAKKLNSFGLRFSLSEDNPRKFTQTLVKIEHAWKEVYPNESFEFSFIDERIRNFYKTEDRTNKLAGTATFITILISCLGLFALASFTALERTKEIGIRKVMGASVNTIVVLLSSEFLKLVLIAFLISVPIAFYFGNQWLSGFAFKINLDVWIFLMAGIVSFLLAFLTISVRTLKAAKADPVKSLRYE